MSLPQTRALGAAVWTGMQAARFIGVKERRWTRSASDGDCQRQEWMQCRVSSHVSWPLHGKHASKVGTVVLRQATIHQCSERTPLGRHGKSSTGSGSEARQESGVGGLVECQVVCLDHCRLWLIGCCAAKGRTLTRRGLGQWENLGQTWWL